ncbi:glycosyltransferase [Fictibacillus barbaricus]|uniref:Glycosyltransferase involved in cell wall biosynthesis n=1 Tax=Fictibacillus barbaricus TaxID=182136 RepID=A0ABU1U1N7_9BACL|nr:glycosyltransferase [Fictibacillus barbaricus]MDR7073362.1 glycosyltransferase involved in cell wall biosynthesis [Fictibacillus barbaricus]
MKKKILFMVINMNVGGTEKALLNMISEMPREEFDITILMLEKYGGFLDLIPKDVQVKYLEGYNKIKPILNKPPKTTAWNLINEGKVLNGLYLLILHFTSKLIKDRSIIFKYILKNIPDFKNDFDIAVAYAGPMDFISYFIVKKIKAKKKIQWIHFDITKIGFNKHFASKIYNKFDQIFVVSKEAKNKLINAVPTIKGKTDIFFNMVSKNEVFKQSKEGTGFNDNFEGERILTVGRLTNEKGQDLAIKVLVRLIKNGYNVRWYCLGEGSSRTEYEKLIAENNLQNNFILLGSNPNPYPFIDQCDIYVQPSRYEGYCISLIEARILKKPIVTTNVNGVNEQIKNGVTGLVVKIDENELYVAVSKLLKDHKLRNILCSNLLDESIKSSIEDKNMSSIFN